MLWSPYPAAHDAPADVAPAVGAAGQAGVRFFSLNSFLPARVGCGFSSFFPGCGPMSVSASFVRHFYYGLAKKI
jgi:hypothetical protein